MDGGATFSSGGGFSLGGTIGQADAGMLSAGGFTLSGGFWHAGEACELAGDLDADGDVDIADLATLLGHFGTGGATPGDGDLDGDVDVDIGDLAMLLSNFGTTCPYTSRRSSATRAAYPRRHDAAFPEGLAASCFPFPASREIQGLRL